MEICCNYCVRIMLATFTSYPHNHLPLGSLDHLGPTASGPQIPWKIQPSMKMGSCRRLHQRGALGYWYWTNEWGSLKCLLKNGEWKDYSLGFWVLKFQVSRSVDSIQLFVTRFCPAKLLQYFHQNILDWSWSVKLVLVFPLLKVRSPELFTCALSTSRGWTW